MRAAHVTQGEFRFKDNLLYNEEDWEYCDEDDRRFFSEWEHGVNPAGKLSSSLHTALYHLSNGFVRPCA